MKFFPGILKNTFVFILECRGALFFFENKRVPVLLFREKVFISSIYLVEDEIKICPEILFY